MKKILMIAVAALAVLAGCKQQTPADALAAFENNVETWADEFAHAAQTVEEDAVLTIEEKTEKLNTLRETVIGKVKEGGKTLLDKFYADTLVAPAVLEKIADLLEETELSDILEKLPEPVKADKFVARLVETNAAKQATAVGKKFTDFTVDHVVGTDKKGEPVYEKRSLSDFVGKGKVMLVDFWSPWCPPCKAEIPNIKAVWEKYHGDDFDVLSVAVWEESRRMDWHNTIDTAAVYGMKWLQINNGHQEPAALYGIEGIPHMILFDKDGTILKRGNDLRGEKTAQAVAEVLGR